MTHFTAKVALLQQRVVKAVAPHTASSVVMITPTNAGRKSGFSQCPNVRDAAPADMPEANLSHKRAGFPALLFCIFA